MGIKDSDELEDIEKWIKLKKTACLTLRKHIDLFKKKFFHNSKLVKNRKYFSTNN